MPDDQFTEAESPDHPGWRVWSLTDPTRFNTLLGPLLFRIDGAVARLRMTPEHRHSNLRDHVHGGALLGFVDVALFAAARGFGLIVAGAAVTLDLNTQFIGAGVIGEPIEAQVEILKETGRLLFLRGLVVQGEATIAAFSATVRKPGNDQQPCESHPHPSAATPLPPSPTGRGKGPARGASGKGEGER